MWKLWEIYCSVLLLIFYFFLVCCGLKDFIVFFFCLLEKMKVEFCIILLDIYGYNIIWEFILEFFFEGNICYEIEIFFFEYMLDIKKYKDVVNELYFYRFGFFFFVLNGFLLNNDFYY